MISKRIRLLSPSPTVSLDARVKILQADGIPVISLCVGEPDFDTPAAIRAEAEKAMSKGLTHYAPISGYQELRQAVAEKFVTENRINYAADQIIIGLGSKALLFTAFQTLVDPGDEVIIPTPSWNTFSEQVRLSGGKAVHVPLMPPFKLTAADIENNLSTKTKVILLNSPANPTGALIAEEELKKIANLAVSRNLYIISDEIYEKIIYHGRHVSIASLGREVSARTITLNGFSKSFAMTGWRIGYAGGPKEIIKAMVNLQGQTGSSAVSFVQMAGRTALKSGNADFREMLQEFKRRRKYLLSELQEIKRFSFVEPEGAFYIFISLKKLLGKEYPTAVKWCEALLEKQRVAVVPGEAFFCPGYFRLSFASSMDNLKKAVKGIKNFVEIC